MVKKMFEISRLMRPFFFLVAFFLAGILVGFVIFGKKTESANGTFAIREGGWEFINPLLEFDIAPPKELVSFKYKLERIEKERIQQKVASHVSVYFRDLNNGPWFGVNERENFAPASLLKVPLSMAYFKWSEKEPGVLGRRVKFEGGDLNKDQNIKPAKELVADHEYSVGELIAYMIKYSENNAFQLLDSNIDSTFLKKTYNDLGLEIPGVRTPENFITVKQYGAFFRVLFNASFLDRENSERLLSWLSESDFRGGLNKGVPDGVKVAHKFGERKNTDTGEIQLHDCGIVYYPAHPYLLCVMTRGWQIEKLAQIIADVSKTVWEEVAYQYIKN